MARAMVGLYCASFRQVPPRIVLDVDGTFDAVHGGQQFRLLNAQYDEYGFQPIVVFEARAARWPRCSAPPGARREPRPAPCCAGWREIRIHRRPVEILIQADSHYCAQEVLEYCRAANPDFVLGAATSTLRRHVAALEQSTATRLAAEPGTDKLRCFRAFHDGTGTWSRLECIIARVGAGLQGTDTRFVVTSLAGDTARRIYEELYCPREQAENHVKA
jgi:hypothetical protein